MQGSDRRADLLIAELLIDAPARPGLGPRKGGRPKRPIPVVDNDAKQAKEVEESAAQKRRTEILAQVSPSINPAVLARTHGIPIKRLRRWARDAGIKLPDGRTRSGQWKSTP